MPKKINKENGRKISECITYYEICNKAEGKSPKTIDWYTAILNMFLHYLHDRHLPNSIDVIDTRLLREYIIYLQNKVRFSNLSCTAGNQIPAGADGHKGRSLHRKKPAGKQAE